MELQYRELCADELTKWFDHVDEVFVNTPRDYFVRHWEQDPDSKPSSILVCVDGDKIVGTVRIYHRSVYFNERILRMGGIGEVSTSDQYRKRGIATQLLEMAITYMNQHQMSISVLSGSQNIYSKLGWNPIPLSITETKIHSNLPNIKEKKTPEIVIQKCNYKNLTDQEKLRIQVMYHETSVRYCGTILRSVPYWEMWVSDHSPNTWLIKEIPEQKLIGYFSVKITENDNKVQIFEFIVLEEIWRSNVKYVFENAIYNMLTETKISDDRIFYSTPLGSFGEIQNTFNDTHQMYKILDCSSEEDTKMVKLFFENCITKHLWWGTDNF